MASIKLKGDTSGEITISAPAVAGTNTISLQATTGTLATTAQVDSVYNSLGVRNLIINGDMRIAQRGTSTTGITTGAYYTIDRFQLGLSSLGTWTMTQDTDVPSGQGFANSLKLQCTTADASPSASDYFNLQYKNEAQNLQHLAYGTSSAKTMTLSFWVKSNKTGTYSTMYYAPDGTRLLPKSYTIDVADTWEKKTITIDGDTSGTINNDNGNGLSLYWFFGVGSDRQGGSSGSWGAYATANEAPDQTVNLADSTSNYINITGIQLEVGTETTPFEHRPYDMELARCQRYFQSYGTSVLVGYWTTGATGFPFKTQMRASPTAYWEYSGTPYRTYRIQDANQYTHSGASAPTSPDFWLYIYNPATTWAQSGSTITSVMVSKATFNAEL